MKKTLIFLFVILCSISFWKIDLRAEEIIYSSNYIMIEVKSGDVLYELGKDEIIYPASMTKIMTLLVALEFLDDYEEVVVINPTVLIGLKEANASVAGFKVGEAITIKDLLYGIILPSGADACEAIAQRVSGSEVDFVKEMNKKAEELGMVNTHFTNATGLHNNNHVSSVSDIATLLKVALNNPTFKAIFESKTYTTTPSNFHTKGLYLTSTTFAAAEEGMTYIQGGKTGFTLEAGLCLASTATQDGMDLILVTAHAPAELGYQPLHLLDAKTLYEQAFSEYHRVKAISMNEELQQLPIGRKLEDTKVSVKAHEEISFLMEKDKNRSDLEYYYEWNKINAPIHQGDLIQKLTISLAGETLGIYEFYAMEDIDADYLFELLSSKYSLYTSVSAAVIFLLVRHLRIRKKQL